MNVAPDQWSSRTKDQKLWWPTPPPCPAVTAPPLSFCLSFFLFWFFCLFVFLCFCLCIFDSLDSFEVRILQYVIGSLYVMRVAAHTTTCILPWNVVGPQLTKFQSKYLIMISHTRRPPSAMYACEQYCFFKGHHCTINRCILVNFRAS